MYPPGGLRQKHRSLAGGVASTDHNHLFSSAQLRFDKCRAVVHACAFKPLQALDRESSILRSRGDHDGARMDASVVVDLDAIGFPVAGKPRGARSTTTLASMRAPS